MFAQKSDITRELFYCVVCRMNFFVRKVTGNFFFCQKRVFAMVKYPYETFPLTSGMYANCMMGGDMARYFRV